MTMKSMHWALHEAPVQNAYQQVILIAMGEFARADGRNCWLSQKSLAETANCSIRSVRTHLKAMEAAGMIRRGNQDNIPAEIPAQRRPVMWDLNLNLVKDRGAAAADADMEPVDNSPDEADESGESGRQDFPPPANPRSEDRQKPESDRQPVADNGLPLREDLRVYARGGTYARACAGAQGLAAPSSLPGFPPLLATVTAGIRAACQHGAPPGRCALCRGVEPTAERPVQEKARSHAEDIRAALRQAASS